MDLLDKAQFGSVDEVRLLIEQGADVNGTNSGGQSALFFVCECGHYDVAEFLVKNGAWVNYKAKPLIAAARNGHADCVDLLLKHGANACCTNMKGETAMSVALEKMNVSVILSLLGHGVRPHIHLGCILTKLFSHARPSDAEMLLQTLNSGILCIKSDEDVLAAFQFAFKNGCQELASYLLSLPSSFNREQAYPLAVYYSVRNNWFDILTELLKRGVDVNVMTDSCTPLHAACEQNDDGAVRLLLQYGANPNLLCCTSVEKWQSVCNRETALHVSCSRSKRSTLGQKAGIADCDKNNLIVSSLLNHGADVNVVCSKGETALYRACMYRQVEVVQMLLDAGADVNLTTSQCYPLIAACTVEHKTVGSEGTGAQFFHMGNVASFTDSNDVEQKHVYASEECASAAVAVIKLLLKNGADVNSKCSIGETALCRATCSGLTDVVRLLLEADADVGDVNEPSTLHSLTVACDHGSAEILDLLLSKLSNCSSLTTDLLRVAVTKCFPDVVDVLLNHGADANMIIVDAGGHRIGSDYGTIMPLLALAAKNGDDAIVKLLIHYGAKLNAQDEYGNTALHIALTSDVVKTLIDAGADVNAVNKTKKTPLYVFCADRQEAHFVELLLESGADPNTFHHDSPLRVACERNNTEVVKLLLAYGANANKMPTYSTYGSPPLFALQLSPLCYACRCGNFVMVSELLRKGALATFANDNGETALHVTVKHIEDSCSEPSAIVGLLIQHGASVNVMPEQGETPLYLACERNLTGVVRQLIESDAYVNLYLFPNCPLLVACERHSREIVSMLLQNGADANFAHEIKMPLTVAAENFDSELIEELLSHGADINMTDVHGNTALYSGAESWRYTERTSEDVISTISILLKCGAKPNERNSYGETALYMMCSRIFQTGINHDVVQLLLESGADPNLIPTSDPSYFDSDDENEGIPPLSYAADYRDVNLMALLIKFGAVLEAKDWSGKTALYHALDRKCHYSPDSSYNTATLDFLLTSGAQVNVTDNHGQSPLYLACKTGLTAVVQKMLKCGAEVNVGKHEKSPLNIACKTKRMAIVKLLLNEGYNPNVPEESEHKTSFSLHIAATDNNAELISLLLNHEANVSVVDASGNTALHHVISNHSYSLSRSTVNTNNDDSGLKILLQAGADPNMCNNNGKTPLYLAAELGLLDFVDDMLSRGGNPNVHGSNTVPLCVACELQNLTLVETLLKAGANPNITTADTDCELPLCIAVRKTNKELAELLLKAGANVNVLNSVRKSALHLTTENWDAYCYYTFTMQKAVDKTHLLKLLLEHDGDVNQLTPDGRSVLSLFIDFIMPYIGSSATPVVDDVIEIMITKGATLADSSSNLGDNFLPGRLRILRSLCAWCSQDQVVVDLFKAGAGFQLLAFYCIRKWCGTQLAKSIRVCQAAVMAGYRPSTEELDEIQESVSGANVPPAYVELLSWLNEDRQQAPSLMRQCRVAVRRQLSVASSHRTILPAIDQLPLPNRLQQYLKFEGSLTEIDLQVYRPTD